MAKQHQTPTNMAKQYELYPVVSPLQHSAIPTFQHSTASIIFASVFIVYSGIPTLLISFLSAFQAPDIKFCTVLSVG